MTSDTFNTTAPTPVSSHDRGSALLIVVGTLALISVFAAIYIAIGQSDQRVANSVKNRQEIVDIQNEFADHILGVLRDDRLDYTAQHNPSGEFIQREATDAPYTDWTMRSESNNLWERFNPSGRHMVSNGGLTAANDFRVASDPWLASTSPTFLGDPGDPIYQLRGDLRPFSSVLTGNQTVFIGNAYSSGFMDNRDWLQISNLAPDGRFVNLFNLRPNQAFNDGTVGGFDAEPGYGTTSIDSSLVRRMSQYLSLWDKEVASDPKSRIKTFDPADRGIWMPGRNEPETGHGLIDLQNIPAVWSMYQRYSFIPLNQPFMTVNRNNQVSTWADPDFAPYQWADADGDGMADARWFELAAARETQSSNSSERDDVERLYDAGAVPPLRRGTRGGPLLDGQCQYRDGSTHRAGAQQRRVNGIDPGGCRSAPYALAC